MAAGFRSAPQELVLVVCAKHAAWYLCTCFWQTCVYSPTQCLEHTSFSTAPIGCTGLLGFSCVSHKYFEVLKRETLISCCINHTDSVRCVLNDLLFSKLMQLLCSNTFTSCIWCAFPLADLHRAYSKVRGSRWGWSPAVGRWAHLCGRHSSSGQVSPAGGAADAAGRQTGSCQPHCQTQEPWIWRWGKF